MVTHEITRNISGLARALAQQGLMTEAEAETLQTQAQQAGIPFVDHVLSGKRISATQLATFASRAFGLPLLSFVVGLALVCSGLTSVATQSRVFAANLAVLFNLESIPLWWLALGFLLVLAGIVFRGIRESMWVNVLCTLVEASGLILVVAVGLDQQGQERAAVEELPDHHLGADRILEEGVEVGRDHGRRPAPPLEEGGDLPRLGLPDGAEHVEVEGLLRRPVAVEEGDVAPGAPGDPLDPRPMVAALGELDPGGVPEPLGDSRAARPGLGRAFDPGLHSGMN